MAQPVLESERLLLVPLAESHFELEVELDSDPDVLRYLFGRARSREEVAEAHARRMAASAKVDGLGFWMAFGTEAGGRGSARPSRQEDGEFVGLMMLPPAYGPDQPDDPTVAELGYRLKAKYWRQGLASEASRVLLLHAFETIGQSRVIAQTMAVNAGSRGVMEAVGLRYTRTWFPTWDDPLPGSDQGEVEYEITQAGWQELQREAPARRLL